MSVTGDSFGFPCSYPFIQKKFGPLWAKYSLLDQNGFGPNLLQSAEKSFLQKTCVELFISNSFLSIEVSKEVWAFLHSSISFIQKSLELVEFGG